MAIDWYRVKFLAVDGGKSIWTYATDQVGRDLRELAETLPKNPTSELVAAERGIAIIFHGSYGNIAKTITRIADKIVTEGIESETTGKKDDGGKTGGSGSEADDGDGAGLRRQGGSGDEADGTDEGS